MICPGCRTQLPAKAALATSFNTVVCKRCAAELRPTLDSAQIIARKTFYPFAALGVAIGSAGVWFGLSTGRWAPLVIALALGMTAAILISWRIAMKHIAFERA
jgi:hypothetical protein